LIWAVICVSGLSILLPSQLYAVELNGQFSSELYIWEGDSDNHIRPYERLRASLMVWRPSLDKNLSFHTYLRWTSDLSDKLPGDPQTYIYDAYLKLKGIPKNSELRLGRQYVYSPVGSALLDGMRVRYRLLKSTELDFFGGSSVTGTDPEEIRSLSDYGTYGGRVTFKPNRVCRLGLNWMLRYDEGSIAYHRVGLDARKQAGRFDLYGKVAYNLEGQRLAEMLGRVVLYTGHWRLSGEFNWREPSVSENSLFSLIDFYCYREIRTEIQRKIYKNFAAVGQFQVDIFEDDDSYLAGFGLRSGAYSLIWVHREGYGGDSDGLKGYGMVRLSRQWELFASADFHRYKIQELQEDRNDNYSAGVGIQKRFTGGWLLKTEGQYLRNAVRSNDFRLFFRISKDFSFKGNSGGGQS